MPTTNNMCIVNFLKNGEWRSMLCQGNYWFFEISKARKNKDWRCL